MLLSLQPDADRDETLKNLRQIQVAATDLSGFDVSGAAYPVLMAYLEWASNSGKAHAWWPFSRFCSYSAGGMSPSAPKGRQFLNEPLRQAVAASTTGTVCQDRVVTSGRSVRWEGGTPEAGWRGWGGDQQYEGVQAPAPIDLVAGGSSRRGGKGDPHG